MHLNVRIDTTDFDKMFKEYMKYTSRTLVEAVNQHAYYTARNATFTTKAATKEQIRQDLEANSQDYTGVPLAAILVNKQRKIAGKKGLNGEKMARAVETFIRKRQASRNFLRAGWIPAIKALEKVVPKKGGHKIPAGTKVKGRPKGGGSAARFSGFKAVASIWNSVFGGKKKASGNVTILISEGAEQALKLEAESMKKYIEQKLAKA